MKISTNKFIKEKGIFPNFIAWASGYKSFTYSHEALPNLIQYVETQEEHHKKYTLEDEIRILLADHQVEFDEKYFNLDE